MLLTVFITPSIVSAYANSSLFFSKVLGVQSSQQRRFEEIFTMFDNISIGKPGKTLVKSIEHGDCKSVRL